MKYTKLAAVALASVMMLSASGQSANSDNPIVMTVGDTQITESEFNYYMNTYKENYNMGQAKKSSLEYCQRNQLIVEVAKAMDITLTDDEAKQVKSTISNFKAQQGGKKAGDKLLKKYGVDDDIIETIISASTYSQQVMDQLDVAEPTDDEVKQYFVDNYLRAKHILISTKDMTTGADLDEDKLAEAEKKANEILERAKNGEDFDALIKE